MSDLDSATRQSTVDILARFFPRSAESRETGRSVGELESSGLRREAILTCDDAEVC
jgi:hypothetical protein